MIVCQEKVTIVVFAVILAEHQRNGTDTGRETGSFSCLSTLLFSDLAFSVEGLMC